MGVYDANGAIDIGPKGANRFLPNAWEVGELPFLAILGVFDISPGEKYIYSILDKIKWRPLAYGR